MRYTGAANRLCFFSSSFHIVTEVASIVVVIVNDFFLPLVLLNIRHFSAIKYWFLIFYHLSHEKLSTTSRCSFFMLCISEITNELTAMKWVFFIWKRSVQFFRCYWFKFRGFWQNKTCCLLAKWTLICKIKRPFTKKK